MKRLILLCWLLLAAAGPAAAQPSVRELIEGYDLRWETQSDDSSGSMPCGGFDTGLNVWVEQNDVLLYFGRSDTFDENNALLKGGRLRLRFAQNPFADRFAQTLKLYDGYVQIEGQGLTVTVWADTAKPVFHVEVESQKPVEAEAIYESWRFADRPIGKERNATTYKWIAPKEARFTADRFEPERNRLTFRHENGAETIFDFVVAQQGMESVKEQMENPLRNRIWGGEIDFGGMVYADTVGGTYLDTPYRGWRYRTVRPTRRLHLTCTEATLQGSTADWRSALAETRRQIDPVRDRQRSRAWWNAFWERSYIVIDRQHPGSEAWKVGRNYQLFRYLLGCNASGAYPTKFNGGLFTFDARPVNGEPWSPDYRNWGGGTMTAQNQRLVYFPMLKSGDFDLMTPQFEFYERARDNAELRTRLYWGHEGASFCEQIENFGLPNPAEYGKKRPEGFDPGMEYNAWLEYQWDTALEFCLMILESNRYAGTAIERYLPLIESVPTFFDRHYRMLARQRGSRELDGEGHLVLYPGSGCETYKMAYNSTSTIAGLRTVVEHLIGYYRRTLDEKEAAERVKPWEEFLATLPPLNYRIVAGKRCLSPAAVWARVQNVEVPQLYPVFPWRIYGVGRDDLETAVNTYTTDPDALKFRSSTGWKQDNIFAACLGLTDEAQRLTLAKFADGKHRYPAFFGPGFDWTPDHNWGGSGMIGLQEMLLQEIGDGLWLFPSWPEQWPVEFRLHAPGRVVVEGSQQAGQARYRIETEEPGRHLPVTLWKKP